MSAIDAGEADGRWGALADAVDALVFITEPSGRMVWANRELERRTGFRVEDFWFENRDNPFIHPDDAGRVGAEIAAFLASDRSVSDEIENRFFDKGGSIRSYRSTVSKVTWKGAPALQFVVREPRGGSAPDVDHEASYRQIVESASDGILKLSSEGRVAYANRRFREMVAIDAVELARRSFVGCVVPAERADVRRHLADVARDGQPVAFECELGTNGDGGCHVSVALTRLTGTASDGLVLALVRDVTEQRRIEAGLRESEKLESLGVLAAGVAHDFNNVVTAILVSAGIAARLVDVGTKLEKVVGEIRGNAQRAAEVTSALLSYVGKSSRRHDVVDLRGIVRDAVPLLRGVVAKNVAFNVAEGPVAAVVLGDSSQLSRVVVNLVMNAAEAAEGRGAVSIAVRTTDILRTEGRWFPACPHEPGPWASFVVTDEGTGIDPGVLDRIFDPFFTTKATGRGLGLSALLGIVRSHGGGIRVESEVGVRTTFEVVLPLAPARGTSAHASTPAPPSAVAPSAPDPGGTILLVDDEPSLRKLGQWILEDAGYDVVAAEGAEAALAAFETSPARFRGAVIDYGLPGVRGDELLVRLRATRPDFPAILTSGYCERDVPRDLAHVFLPKPYGGEQLQDAVRNLLDAARRRPR